jgi:hypothetical protein
MASDPYGCLILGCTGVNNATYPRCEIATIVAGFASQAGHYMARLYTGIGAAVAVGKTGNYTLATYLGNSGLTYPSPVNNGYYIAPVFIADSTVTIRAQLAGLYHPLHPKPFGHGVLIPANVSPINRRLYTVFISYSTAGCELAMDIDGPWR